MLPKRNSFAWLGAAVLALAGAGAGVVFAAGPTSQPQIQAALDAAVAKLLANISAENLSPEMTVGEFLHRTGSRDILIKTLQQRPELVAGPRWTDAQTCQVKLQISGQRVLATLKQIAADNPRSTPLTPEALDRAAAAFRGHDFEAVGTSTTGLPMGELRPSPDNKAWKNVSDADRAEAVAAARRDALAHVLDSLRPVHLGSSATSPTVGEVLKKPAIFEGITQWFAQQPVTQAQFGREMQVELVLAVTPEQMLAALRAQIAADAGDLKDLDLPNAGDEAAWSRIGQDFSRHFAAPMGRGTIPTDISPPSPSLPAAAPAWAETHAQASGTAAMTGSKLRSALSAETIARRKLREEIDALPLSQRQTIAQAATQDARLRRVLDRIVADEKKAKITQTEYDEAHGKVTVHVSLELRELWDELRDQP